MSPEEKDPKDAQEETPEATEATPKPKPKPKRKPTSKKPAKSAADVEKEVSEEAAKSTPRPDEDVEDAPTPAEETSEAAAVEKAVTEERTQQPAKPRRKKPADTQRPSASSTGDDDEPEAEESKPAAEESTPADKPARKRDQPRQRQPGEAPVLVSAKARYVRTSARKARLVCDHIRGKDVEQARAILSFTPRGAAKPWMKLLESAIANAEHNHELVGDELKIASVHADEGPTLKRYRPRAMGRATRIRKRTSHLSITLTPKE